MPDNDGRPRPLAVRYQSLGRSRCPSKLEGAWSSIRRPPIPGSVPDCCVMPLELPPDDPCWFCRYLAGTAPYTILERTTPPPRSSRSNSAAKATSLSCRSDTSKPSSNWPRTNSGR